MRKKDLERNESIVSLDRDYGLKEIETVYVSLAHVSASGMTRSIKVFVVNDNKLFNVSWHVARALGWRFDDNRAAVVVRGCGMDMGFHLVDQLAYTMQRFGPKRQFNYIWV